MGEYAKNSNGATVCLVCNVGGNLSLKHGAYGVDIVVSPLFAHLK